jgi:hypothetical protein
MEIDGALIALEEWAVRAVFSVLMRAPLAFETLCATGTMAKPRIRGIPRRQIPVRQ